MTAVSGPPPPAPASANGPDTVARSGLYRRFFAWLLARLAPEHDALLADRKRALFADLEGTVVEIGPGTGINLQYLPDEIRYIAVEPNLHLHPYLRRAAAERGLEIDLRVGTAEGLPVESAAADAVLSTLVLCSVTDVAAVLGEVRRVLRPGGRFVFIEHVAAETGSRLHRWQRRIKPMWRWIGDGCEPDRDLSASIRDAGFAAVRLESFRVDIPMPLVRPHIAGWATA